MYNWEREEEGRGGVGLALPQVTILRGKKRGREGRGEERRGGTISCRELKVVGGRGRSQETLLTNVRKI
jgi:hypothetical protein